jgi:PEP-CTERM motif-containing protein
MSSLLGNGRGKDARMRYRPTFSLIALLAVILLGSEPARADPITITVTSGTADFNPNTDSGVGIPFHLFGTGGFSLTASALLGDSGPGCCVAPGQTRTFHGFWSGNDLSGTATYGGQTFTDLGSLNSANSASVSFLSDPFILPTRGSATATISAPFTLTGSFRGAPGSAHLEQPTLFATLKGSGIGRLSLVFRPEAGEWDPRSVHLDITSVAPTPEPASLLLLATGAAAAFRVRRRSQTRAGSSSR